MNEGIKVISYPNHSGYGLSALAYVRALHNAGIPVWWAPLIVRHGRHTIWQPGDRLDELPLSIASGDDASLQDVAALLNACGPKPYAKVLAHILPEHWQSVFEPGKRCIGYTVWETDTLPLHWPPLLSAADKVLVPCAMNLRLFESAKFGKPVAAVPHIRRHAWNSVTSGEIAGLRQQLEIPEDHFVFYSINVWDPRKAIRDLVTAFGRTFSGHDKVTLVLKTSTWISELSLESASGRRIPEYVEALLDEVSRTTGRPAPNVVTIAADGLAGRVIDALHGLGDCFVSLTHGEGWGMGAFDAATLGNPVLITGYGGPEEYFASDYPGLIPYTLETVSGWVPQASFRPPQCWARPDPLAIDRLLRRMVSHHSEFLDAAALAAERIANRYAEPVVARQLIAALDD
jgi:glycosyltransferase involved in cell wall biosynthesis